MGEQKSDRFETKGDALASPSSATWVGKTALVVAVWVNALGMLLTDSHTAGLFAAAFAASAYVVVRRVAAVPPIEVAEDSIAHGAFRMPRVDLSVTRGAWVGSDGRIGSALVLRHGVDELRVGARGEVRATRSVNEATAIPRVHVCLRSIEELDQLADVVAAAELPAATASPYRGAARPPEPSSRTFWVSSRAATWSDMIPLFGATMGVSLAAHLILGLVRGRFGAPGVDLMLACVVSAAVAGTFHDRYRARSVHTRCLRISGRSIALEVDGKTTWSVADARGTGARLAHAGPLAILELRRVDGDVLRIASTSEHRGADEAEASDLRVSPSEFDWLLSHVGLLPGPPLTRVADESEHESERESESESESESGRG